MKISEKFHQAAREGRIVWSFEYFPPRTAQGLQNLYDRIERMRMLGPEFIDITWGAGGKSSDLTLNLVQCCQETIGMETCMHLCCTEMPAEKVKESLRIAKEHGCQNILALRGDPPNGQSTWTPTPGGFSRAIDLVKYIRTEYGDYFDIAVAGFPQGHPETDNDEEAKRLEIQYLKEKVDAGANFIFTQMFYDVGIFVDWVKRVRAAGINVPIVPGIMPIQSWQKFQTWVKRENIIVPPHWYELLNPVQDDDEQVRAVGTKLVGEMCRQILDAGVGITGLHVYTLNLEKGARMLLEEVGLEARREQVAPLPWRPSLTPHRRTESIRPIFWANRVQSYLSRTEDWDEFPNGRWGDSRSPAYGDLDGYPVKIDFKVEDALEMWGKPERFEDVAQLFARFCRNELKALPWSTSAPSAETSVINNQLARMNELGYLTINSQPAVDGASSTDKTHGWGPAGGYVYQKAYLEFFVAPHLLDELVKRVERDPRITYYAVNKQGDLRTNTHSEGPNAVTWGVFPGKEIIQPTIVEAVSFVAWKDEAFELGMQWSYFYPEGSASRKLIQDIMATSYLVNIVANDFKDGLSIFEPFQLDKADAAHIQQQANGVAKTAVNGVRSAANSVASAASTAAAAVVGAVSTANGAATPNGTSSAASTANGSSEPSTANGHSEPSAPAPKVGPEPRQKKTMADMDKIFDESPLFMRKAPEGGEDNDALEALKTLIFEGDGDEVATNLKNQGTECHQQGKLREALTFYTQALEAKPQDEPLVESLLLNRSACNLSLGNYRSVLRDTADVIRKNPSNAKAFFRASSALLALERWDDAIDCIKHGRALSSEQETDKQTMWDGLDAKAQAGNRKVGDRTERLRRDKVGKEAFKRALDHRGLIQVSTSAPPVNPAEAHFEAREELPLASTEKWFPPPVDHSIIFPVFLLYPQHSQSDLITAFHEHTTFEDQLEVMFPKTSAGDASIPWADWDQSRSYFADNLVVYAETRGKKLLKVGRGLTLRQVIDKATGLSKPEDGKDGVVMQDGLLSFVVLPKGHDEKTWVDNFKKARDGQ